MQITTSPTFRRMPWPSPTGLLRTLLIGLRDRRRRWRELRDDRDAFMHLLRLDDQILDDIGVSRDEVEWAASLPLEVNASAALRQRGAERRARRDKRRPCAASAGERPF